jgi:outer membrane protein
MFFYKKKFFIFFCFIFFSFNAYSNENIAYLDIDYVFKNSIFGNKIIQGLNDTNKKNIDDFKKKENELIKLEKELIKKKNIISQEEFNEKFLKLKADVKLFRTKKNDIINKFEKNKNNEIKSFFEKINPLVKEFMKENSIDILINKKYIIVGADRLDITQKIKKIIDKEFK